MNSEGEIVRVTVKSTCLIMYLHLGIKRVIFSLNAHEFKPLLKVYQS